MQTLPFTLLKLDKRKDNLETTSEIVEMVPMINTQEFTASQFDPSPRAFSCNSLVIVEIKQKICRRAKSKVLLNFFFSSDHSANVVVVTEQHPF